VVRDARTLQNAFAEIDKQRAMVQLCKSTTAALAAMRE
jgi:hypothetical protein